MTFKRREILRKLVPFCGIAFILSINSCSQYEYSSPLPGIIDVRLRTISDTSRISFSPLNNFVLKVTSLEGVRDDYARSPIYEDTKAIGRTANVYNTLDVRARDSSLIMGEGYLPPGNYVGVNLLIQPGGKVVLDGYRDIDIKLPDRFNALLTFRKPFQIRELETTSIVVTIDLDSSLVQGANVYYFKPYYYISSIQ